MASSAPSLRTSCERAGERGALVRHAPLGDDRSAGRRQTLVGDFQGLFDDLGREAGKDRRHHADLADAVRRHAQQRLFDARERRIARLLADREGNDLHGGDHLAGDHRLVGRQRGEGDRLVDAVELIDGVLIDDQNAGVLCEQIGAPGKGTIDVHALARDLPGDLGRGNILGDVARFEAGDHDFLNAGGFKGSNFGSADQRALLQHQRALPDAMHGGRAKRILGRYAAEFHDAAFPHPTVPRKRARDWEGVCVRLGVQPVGNLRHDGDRDLRRRYRADVEADRRMDARQIGVGQTLLFEPLDAARMSFPRPERADIETVARRAHEAAPGRRSWDRG